jgi:hypothetical protein
MDGWTLGLSKYLKAKPYELVVLCDDLASTCKSTRKQL